MWGSIPILIGLAGPIGMGILGGGPILIGGVLVFGLVRAGGSGIGAGPPIGIPTGFGAITRIITGILI